SGASTGGRDTTGQPFVPPGLERVGVSREEISQYGYRGTGRGRVLVGVRWAGRWCHDRQCWHQIARSSPVIRVLAVPGGNGGVVDGDVHQRQRATGAVCTNAVIL